MKLPARVFGVLGAALLALSAAVQLNDPDPWAWTTFYALGAAAAAALPWRREARRPAAALLLVAVVWAVAIAARRPGSVTAGELVGAVGMKTLDVELWRELGGLLLTAGWLGVELLLTRDGQSPARPRSP